MRRSMMTTLLALALSAGTSHAAPVWTGADDQPSSPLACDGAPAAAAPVAYNGGAPAKASERKGKTIKVVDVPKLVGIGYFNSTSQGVKEAAKEHC